MQLPRLARYGMVVVAAVGLLSIGCSSDQPEPQAAETQPAALPTPPEPTPPPPPVQPQPPAPPARQQATADASYSNDTPWAPGFEGKLILGLDGGQYDPYRAGVVRRVQKFLFDQELYDGPVTGVLDAETMKAVGRFQAERGIAESGVPSPETRKAMDAVEAGSAGNQS
ncbi:MAG: hypothetical protein GC160_01095 [Acidobacteria bacterium]|nr:hypothetical protein [Acidobacteriota bacterium]